MQASQRRDERRTSFLAVGLGAALGGIGRYAVGLFFLSRFGPGFPFGTLFINVSGSFCIGIVAALAQTRALGFHPLLGIALTANPCSAATRRSPASPTRR